MEAGVIAGLFEDEAASPECGEGSGVGSGGGVFDVLEGGVGFERGGEAAGLAESAGEAEERAGAKCGAGTRGESAIERRGAGEVVLKELGAFGFSKGGSWSRGEDGRRCVEEERTTGEGDEEGAGLGLSAESLVERKVEGAGGAVGCLFPAVGEAARLELAVLFEQTEA